MFKFEQDDEFDVIWSGGELLPPRDSQNDGRWAGMEAYFGDIHKGNSEGRSIRPYTKVHLDRWRSIDKRARALRSRPPNIQPGPADPPRQAKIEDPEHS